MSEHNEINGDAKIILVRLGAVESELKDVKSTLGQLRDRVMGTNFCSAPNTCLRLEHDIEKMAKETAQAQRDLWKAITAIRQYVWMGIGIVTVISAVVPTLLRLWVNHLNQ